VAARQTCAPAAVEAVVLVEVDELGAVEAAALLWRLVLAVTVVVTVVELPQPVNAIVTAQARITRKPIERALARDRIGVSSCN
jgi:hypothetical protein